MLILSVDAEKAFDKILTLFHHKISQKTGTIKKFIQFDKGVL